MHLFTIKTPVTGGYCALRCGANGNSKPPTVTGVFLLLKTMDITTEVLTMYRNIRKLPQLTASTIVLFCELDYLLRRVPDLQITRTVLARRLNMHTDTVTRGLNTLMQQHVIHFEADFHSGTIHSIVVNPKSLF